MYNLGAALSSLIYAYLSTLPHDIEVQSTEHWVKIRSTYQGTYAPFTVSHWHLWPKVYAKMRLRGYPAPDTLRRAA